MATIDRRKTGVAKFAGKQLLLGLPIEPVNEFYTTTYTIILTRLKLLYFLIIQMTSVKDYQTFFDTIIEQYSDQDTYTR